METYFRIVSLLGGLALFLYGMRIMGDGLKSSSGNAMKVGLAKVTNNPFVGFVFGMLVTCMIQSSTATIVLTVGLVGAGFLSFRKSVGIVLGANVGTAITAQIIRLMDLQASSGSILNFFKSDNLAPTALIIGIILIMFVGTRAATSAGTIFMGFGILFVGLMNMSSAVSAMQEPLSKFLVSFENNYFLGFLAGVLVTGVIQSSSAVVGIIQTLASSVGVTFAGIFAVIVGVNIGDCVTTYLVCRIGAKPEQIRTCLVHIIYNVFAAVLIFLTIFILRSTGIIPDSLWYMTLNSGGVANVHGLFRLVPAVVLLPFANKFADIAEKLVPDKPLDPEDADIEKNLRELDMRLVTNPGLALNESHHLIYHMAGTAMHNLEACRQQMDEYDDKRSARIHHREEMLDRMADSCNKYIIAISPNVTLERDLRTQSYQMKAYVCFERIGDLAVNISEAIDRMHESKSTFTKQALSELRVGLDAVHHVLELSEAACKTDDARLARQVEPMEEVVDELIDTLNGHHVARLTKGKCSIENGIEYQNILNNLERISDQCSDYAVALLAKTDDSIEGNEHEYINQIHTSGDPVYRANYEADRAFYFDELEQVSGKIKGQGKDSKEKGKKGGHPAAGQPQAGISISESSSAAGRGWMAPATGVAGPERGRQGSVKVVKAEKSSSVKSPVTKLSLEKPSLAKASLAQEGGLADVNAQHVHTAPLQMAQDVPVTQPLHDNMQKDTKKSGYSHSVPEPEHMPVQNVRLQDTSKEQETASAGISSSEAGTAPVRTQMKKQGSRENPHRRDHKKSGKHGKDGKNRKHGK